MRHDRIEPAVKFRIAAAALDDLVCDRFGDYDRARGQFLGGVLGRYFRQGGEVRSRAGVAVCDRGERRKSFGTRFPDQIGWSDADL